MLPLLADAAWKFWLQYCPPVAVEGSSLGKCNRGGDRCVELVSPILQRDLIGSRPGCHAGSLAASSSTFSILGGELSKVAALAIKAAAI